MSESKLHTIIRYNGEAAVVDCLDSKLNEEMTIQAWGEELTNALGRCAKGYKRVVVNFQNVMFMSSSALRVLITLNSKAKQAKVQLFLCCINSNILEVFKLTKLDSLFKIRASEIEAVMSK